MIKQSLLFIGKTYHYRRLIFVMARQELAQRYVETFGGPLWAVLQPIATVLVYFFVFSVGFKAEGPTRMPFILYFLGGYIPWLIFSETISASANSIVANPHLVKKILFPVEILPISHLVASCLTHALLLFILALLAFYYGYTPSLNIFYVVYYFASLSVIIVGLSWIVAALQVFFRDLGQALVIILNLWFWITPIVWPKDILPVTYAWVADYNPIFYIIEGYRSSIFHGNYQMVSVWHGLRYWLIALPVLFIGAQVFRKLKKDFPDTL